MIISHKYKFIFIKTYKTAGTSLEVFLSDQCGPKDVLTPIEPHVEPHLARNYRGVWNPLPEIRSESDRPVKVVLAELMGRSKFYNHIPARIVRHRVPKQVWHEYFKFSIERNPWDKTLSHYYMMHDRAGGNLTFDQYLQTGFFSINYPVYSDLQGDLLVDRVIRYEQLNDDLAEIFGRLGVPFSGSLGVRAKSEHRKDRSPYQQLYTPEQRAVVEEAFAKEIAMHGYTF